MPRDGETVGEVIMRGNSVMARYHDKPDETEEAFRGGWFHSGDLAVWHPDGYVDLRDRAKDIIISGGENISSIEVESALVQAPRRARGRRWSRCPTRSGASGRRRSSRPRRAPTLSEEDLIAFCRDNLARFKCPASVEFCELPRTSTGKVQKFVLREREWAGREKAIG